MLQLIAIFCELYLKIMFAAQSDDLELQYAAVSDFYSFPSPSESFLADFRLLFGEQQLLVHQWLLVGACRGKEGNLLREVI